jgi:hypothetical protein
VTSSLRCGLVGVVVLATLGCRVKETSSAPGQGSGAGDDASGITAPLVPEVPPVYASGEPLQATIPGLDGAALELQQLRGRVVVLAFVDPTTPELTTHMERHRAAAAGEGISFVLVATEASTTREFGGLDSWIGKPDVFVGWDPQGALAMKLRIERMPTTLVLDHDGRVVGELTEPDEAGLSEAVDRARRSAAAQADRGTSPADLTGSRTGTSSTAAAEQASGAAERSE